MDRDAKAAVAFKLVIDSVAAALMLYSLDECYLVYMKEYHFNAYSILHEFDYYGANGTSEIGFEEFRQRKCSQQSGDLTTAALCDVLLDEKVAGAAYLIFTCVATVLMLYNALNTLGQVCYFTFAGLIQRKEAQFAVLPLYCCGVLLYVLLSRLFTLQAPGGSEFAAVPDTGFYVMVAALLVNVGSLAYYVVTLGDLAVLEMAGKQGMQQLVQRHLALGPK